MYLYNVTHQHSLPYLDVVNVGTKKTPDLEVLRRPTHAQEVTMIFPVLSPVLGPLSEEEVVQSRRFITFLYDFMAHGKPSPGPELQDWRPVTEERVTHLVFENDGFRTEEGLPFETRLDLWRTLPWLDSSGGARGGREEL